MSNPKKEKERVQDERGGRNIFLKPKKQRRCEETSVNKEGKVDTGGRNRRGGSWRQRSKHNPSAPAPPEC